MANTAAEKISASMTNVTVIGKEDAKNNYPKTVVIDLSGNQSQTATQIANLLGGQVSSSIPDGEIKPNADILVILGTNFSK